MNFFIQNVNEERQSEETSLLYPDFIYQSKEILFRWSITNYKKYIISIALNLSVISYKK